METGSDIKHNKKTVAILTLIVAVGIIIMFAVFGNSIYNTQSHEIDEPYDPKYFNIEMLMTNISDYPVFPKETVMDEESVTTDSTELEL